MIKIINTNTFNNITVLTPHTVTNTNHIICKEYVCYATLSKNKCIWKGTSLKPTKALNPELSNLAPVDQHGPAMTLLVTVINGGGFCRAISHNQVIYDDASEIRGLNPGLATPSLLGS